MASGGELSDIRLKAKQLDFELIKHPPLNPLPLREGKTLFNIITAEQYGGYHDNP